MAQKVQITLIDDLDGQEADETVQFGLDGVSFEIDVSSKNAGKLRDALAIYVAGGRRVSGRRTSARKAKGREVAPADIRIWGRSNGWKVPDRGRIPADVRDAYAAAH